MQLDQFPSARAHRSRLPRLPRRRRGVIRLGLRIAGMVFVFLAVMLGALVAALALGPVEIDGLRYRIAASMSAELGPAYDVSVGSVSIDVDPVMGLMAHVRELRIEDRGHAMVAHVPDARFGIDPLALFRFRLDIQQVEISEPELSLVRGLDGGIYLGTADHIPVDVPVTDDTTAPHVGRLPPPPPVPPAISGIDGGFPDLFTALHILARALDPAVQAAVDRNFRMLAIDSATVHIWDAKKRQQREFPNSDLAFNLDADGAVKASFSTSGYGGRWTITGERRVDPANEDRTLSMSFSQLTIADIEPAFGKADSLVVSNIPLSGRATVVMARNGDVKNARLRFDLGAGSFVSGFGKDTVLLDRAVIQVHWDVAQRVLVLEPSDFEFGPTKARFTGLIKPIGDGSDGRYSFNFESNGAILAADSRSPPITADRIALVGETNFGAKRIDITEFALATPVASLQAKGWLGLEGATPSLTLSASFTPMTIAALKQIWPPILGGPARNWVFEHVTGGRVVSAHFEAAVPGGVLWTGERVTMPEDYMRLDARLADVSFTTIGTVPPITGVSGNAVVAGSTFGIDIDGGSMISPDGDEVRLINGIFAVPNTALADTQSRVEVEFEGAVATIAAIVDSEPMRAMARNHIRPSDLSGKGRGALSISMPLKPHLTQSDIQWRARLDTTGFASRQPIRGRLIENGAFQMVATADLFALKGKATINGVMAAIDISQPIGEGEDDNRQSGRSSVQLVLDAAARKKLGIGMEDSLGGTIGLSISDLADGRKGQHYIVDIEQARLVFDALGWTKGVGVPGTLAFDLVPRDGGGFLVSNIVAAGEGFGFRGEAVLDAKYGLVSANIEHFALRKGDDVSVKLARKGSGYQITIRGAAFDVRGLVAQLKSSGPGQGAASDLMIDARIDQISGFGQQVLANAAVTVEVSSGTLAKVALSGRFANGPVTLAFSDGGSGGATLDLKSDDAGGLLAFLDLYGRISGGQLRLTGTRPGLRGAMTGVFDIADFAIVNERSMRKLVSATEGTGTDQRASGLDPDHVPFDRMRLDYTKRDSLLVIDDAVLRGATVGATLSGTIDLVRQQVALAGTYLPAYAVNNLFGRLPLLGFALGGGSQGGLIGVTFKIEGPLSGPSLTVNPLSMITPGIFRKIFEFPIN